jgi:protocatechuate 3,4-dioxygenase beta subunit
MRARASARSFVVGMVALTSGLAAAQAPLQNQPPRGRGFIVGQVVDADGGRPIPAAMVQLGGGPAAPAEAGLLPPEMAVMPSPPRQVIADASGRFIFRELAAGGYSIRANAPGFLFGSYGASRPGGLAQSVILERDDDRKGGLVIRLWKAAAVSGRIVDEFGEPAIGVQVRIYRRAFSAGRLRLSTGGFASTDDRGTYRFAGLTPGEYVVVVLSSATTVPVSVTEAYFQAITAGGAATEQFSNERTSSGAPFPSTSGFRVGEYVLATDAGRGGTPIAAPAEDGRVMNVPSTFYPGVTSVTQAGVLGLGSGEERTGVDFQLKPRRAVSVSGIVTGPDGPVANIGIRLLIPGAEEFTTPTGMDAAVTQTDATGRFTMLGVTPGTYTLQCIRVPRAQGPRFSPSTSIEVVGPGGAMMGVSSAGPLTTASLPLPADPTLWAVMPVTVGESDPEVRVLQQSSHCDLADDSIVRREGPRKWIQWRSGQERLPACLDWVVVGEIERHAKSRLPLLHDGRCDEVLRRASNSELRSRTGRREAFRCPRVASG